MNKISLGIIIFAFSIGIVLIYFGAYYTKFSKIEDLRYIDPSLPVESRIESLLSQMTLKEKIGQMALVEKNSIHSLGDIALYGLGGVLSGGGAKPKNNTASGWLDMVTRYGKASYVSRLGIPIVYGVDAVHGHGNVPGATIFPHAIGLGATNDPVLVEAIAKTTAKEARATGIFWLFSPNLDAPEDIRWGRVYETFSSDYKLNANLGSAYIQGLQGRASTTIEMLATAKHYLGAGGMKWGSSANKDFVIDQGTTVFDEETLRTFYVPPFKAAIDAGVLSVMVGLNSVGKQKISANKYLISDVLKEELGFSGFVVSDWYGVYEIPGGEYAAVVTAINAGVDMVMLPYDYKTFIKNVTTAVQKGDIPKARIDDAVQRILRAKFAVGLFEKNPLEDVSVVGSSEHRTLAREAVSKSLVLLQNKNQVLPLSINIKKILIAGSAAHNTGKQSGAWTVEWQGIDGNAIIGATSILEGIKKKLNPNTEVLYNQRGYFEVSENIADIGIAIVGETSYAEGWGDEENPALSREDTDAISLLKKSSKKVVVIIISGRPLILPEEINDWDALVAAWLPGSEGEGVADVLFGKKPFSGKLPLPWPSSLSQLPFSPDGVSANKTEPLFQKGFGLGK